MDKIEVLMAVYNGSAYIREQIDSILNQTYENWHLTISDDGSTDGTDLIADEYAVKYPEGVTGQIAAGEEIAAGRAKTFVLRVDGRTAGSGNYFVHVELLVSDALSPLCDLRVRGRFE